MRVHPFFAQFFITAEAKQTKKQTRNFLCYLIKSQSLYLPFISSLLHTHVCLLSLARARGLCTFILTAPRQGWSTRRGEKNRDLCDHPKVMSCDTTLGKTLCSRIAGKRYVAVKGVQIAAGFIA